MTVYETTQHSTELHIFSFCLWMFNFWYSK